MVIPMTGDEWLGAVFRKQWVIDGLSLSIYNQDATNPSRLKVVFNKEIEKRISEIKEASTSIEQKREEIKKLNEFLADIETLSHQLFHNIIIEDEREAYEIVANAYRCPVCNQIDYHSYRYPNQISRQTWSTTRTILCPDCYPKYEKERLRVKYQNRRAEVLGLRHDLTLQQWIDILNSNSWKCVYCKGLFEAMDHIVSVADGGGTTANNVVPACNHCNIKRGQVISGQLSLRLWANR